MEVLEAAPSDSGSEADPGAVKRKFSPATIHLIGIFGKDAGEPVMCACDDP